MQYFKTAILRLTLLYVLVLVLLSSACSFWLYEAAGHEVSTVVLEQHTTSTQIGQPSTGTVKSIDDMPILRASKVRLLHNLLFFNLAVLGAGTLVSYALAQRTLRPIRQSYQKQQQFAANASHQLRTPLTALKTELQVALHAPDLDKAETKRVLASSIEEVDQLSSLTAKLLRLSRTTHTTAAAADVHAVALRAQKRLAMAASQKHITFKRAVPQLSARIDSDELLELLTVLIENAITYSPPRASVTLAAHQQRGHVLITVEDKGPGIDPADLPHIFERFYRGKSQHGGTHHSGNGLGLAIAQDIASAAGGSITASNYAEGAIFTVILPN